jgi:hypothetical protein
MPYSLNFDVNWPLHSRSTNSNCELDFMSPNWLARIYNNVLYWLQTTNVWINDRWGFSVRKCCPFHFHLFLNLALDRSQLHAPAALPRRKSPRYPLNRKLVGQRWSLFRIYILDMSVLIVILNRRIWEREREREQCYIYVYYLYSWWQINEVGVWIFGRKPKYLGKEGLFQWQFDHHKSHMD